MAKQFFVYILTNPGTTVLYTGVTSDLGRRLQAHQSKAMPGFTARYHCQKLIWCERHESAESAITREKQIKSWRRQRKLDLIGELNPTWKDLSADTGIL